MFPAEFPSHPFKVFSDTYRKFTGIWWCPFVYLATLLILTGLNAQRELERQICELRGRTATQCASRNFRSFSCTLGATNAPCFLPILILTLRVLVAISLDTDVSRNASPYKSLWTRDQNMSNRKYIHIGVMKAYKPNETSGRQTLANWEICLHV